MFIFLNTFKYVSAHETITLINASIIARAKTSFLISRVPTQNHSFYKNKEFSNLLIKAKRVSDQKEREALYLKAQEIIHKDAPYVPLAYPYSVVPHLSKVKGYKTTGVSVNRFFKVYLEK